MDKEWINAPRVSDAYKNGCMSFIQFASYKDAQETIPCPCLKCHNDKRFSTEKVLHHILFNGFCPGYTTWTLHGESLSSEYDTSYIKSLVSQKTDIAREIPISSSIRDMIHAALETNLGGNMNCEVVESSEVQASKNDDGFHDNIPPSPKHLDDSFCGIDTSRYQKILDECDKELYPGCKYSQLYFNLTLIHIKCMRGLSNKSFTMLLEFLKDVFPFLTSLPTSAYEAKKLCNDLGLGYEKIHSCPNDCMLYWGEKADQEACYVCGSSRWKCEEKDSNKDTATDELDEQPSTHIRKKAAKVMRYFPLIPRLKRIYASKKTAEDMRWHKTGRTNDGKLRHPADGKAWKRFDELHPEFAADPRSVRLALASDGFNPFRTMSTSYSTWPVVLIPYNLPPWLCMKQTSFILSMIIPGEKGPGNDIDVFLQPLIHELKQLWHGVDVFDAFSNEIFKLQAALMWTVNDFPAYAMLSGWSTKGRVACPICTESTCSMWLKHGKKFSYMGHRRWLVDSHPYRYQKDSFDGTQEFRIPPKPPTGSQILHQVRGTIFQHGKSSKSSKKRMREKENSLTSDIFDDLDGFIEEDGNWEEQLWKKRSIFFDLPYWEHNLLRHNLDIMHIEKNVCDNLLGTLLNLERKTKDDERARKDIMEMGIRPDLHLRDQMDKNLYAPQACFNMSSSEKIAFLEVLKHLKVPDGYASNISRGVNLKDKKLSNLKSHDAHILMQDILPIACKASMRSREKTKLVKVVSDLCSIFKRLCYKVLDPAELDKLESEVGITLSEMEQLFLPSFFTIMVHVTVHLVSEARLGGPVMYRWMYPIERFLMRLKSYVRNRAQPEGSIAEGYIADECLTFCSRYFDGIETRFNRPRRNDDNLSDKNRYFLMSGGRSEGRVEIIELDDLSLAQAHRYVLLQSPKISPYLDHFLRERRNMFPGQVNQKVENKWVVEEFPWWLQHQVSIMEKHQCDEETIALARGPNSFAKRYKTFKINGFKFHTKDQESHRKTQNSGVVVEVKEGGRENMVKKYYGCIIDINELDYYGKGSVVIFRCEWVNINSSKGLKKDKYGLPLVSFSKLIHTGEVLSDDPFVLSTDAKQVFYVQDSKDSDWMHVVETKPRDLYDMGSKLEGDYDDTYP